MQIGGSKAGAGSDGVSLKKVEVTGQFGGSTGVLTEFFGDKRKRSEGTRTHHSFCHPPHPIYDSWLRS